MAANTTTQNSETQNVPVQKKQRFFKCMYNNETKGRYSGYKPKQAANKALTSIIKDTVTNNGKNPDSINGQKFTFEMVECTRGGKRKISLYEGERVKLPKPLEVVIKKNGENKKITYNYQNKLHKIKEEAKKNDEENVDENEEKVEQKVEQKGGKSKKSEKADKKEKPAKKEKSSDKKEKTTGKKEAKTKSDKKENKENKEKTVDKKEPKVEKTTNKKEKKTDKKEAAKVEKKTDKKETKSEKKVDKKDTKKSVKK